MYIKSSQLIFSPSDLTQFMESPFVSWIEHLAVVHPDLLPTPDGKDELIDVLQHLGNQHELELLVLFEEQGLSVVNLHQQPNSYEATLTAMNDGVDVIYQAHLQLLPFQGYADFLIKKQVKVDRGIIAMKFGIPSLLALSNRVFCYNYAAMRKCLKQCRAVEQNTSQ